MGKVGNLITDNRYALGVTLTVNISVSWVSVCG